MEVAPGGEHPDSFHSLALLDPHLGDSKGLARRVLRQSPMSEKQNLRRLVGTMSLVALAVASLGFGACPGKAGANCFMDQNNCKSPWVCQSWNVDTHPNMGTCH